MKTLHLRKFSFIQIKFTCNFNLMNFGECFLKNEVIICTKMNKH